VNGAIVIGWIFPPVFLTILGILGSDITNGTCAPWGAYSSYALEKGVGFSIFLAEYLLPLATMVFCYYRIVYTIKRKVSSTIFRSLKVLLYFIYRQKLMSAM